MRFLDSSGAADEALYRGSGGRPAIMKKLEEQREALLRLRRRLEDVGQLGGIEISADPSSS